MAAGKNYIILNRFSKETIGFRHFDIKRLDLLEIKLKICIIPPCRFCILKKKFSVK